jgi:hypothetical protein
MQLSGLQCGGRWGRGYVFLGWDRAFEGMEGLNGQQFWRQELRGAGLLPLPA